MNLLCLHILVSGQKHCEFNWYSEALSKGYKINLQMILRTLNGPHYKLLQCRCCINFMYRSSEVKERVYYQRRLGVSLLIYASSLHFYLPFDGEM